MAILKVQFNIKVDLTLVVSKLKVWFKTQQT